MEKKITELYEKLNIPESTWPEYTDPYNFAKQIDKCALTINIFTKTSSSSSAHIESVNNTSKMNTYSI